MVETTTTPAPAVSKTPTYRIKSLSVTVEIADKEYGNGNSGHSTMSAFVDDATLEQIDDVVDAGLNLYFAAVETVLAGKIAGRLLGMGAEEFQTTITKIRKGVAKVRELLRAGRAAAEVSQ